MDAERLKQIEEIYHAAVEIPFAGREAFFNQFCGADEDLRREVESLLSYENSSGDFLVTPPESLAAEIFAGKNNQADLIGREIGHYKIIELLGKGGMGEVFLAQDTKLDRKVALKILPLEFSEDNDRMSRFVREAKSASALNHPNIITIYEIGESDGTHFIATEFIDGKTLNDFKKVNPLNYKSALEISIQIASALDEAHHAGIVHRDIKPDNVMIRSNGLAKILDFGIAKLSATSTSASNSSEDATAIKSGTSPGMIIGTANYMSPEQAKGKEVDARTDIFSFGVLLYGMMAGKLPFAGENALETISSILKDEPKPLPANIPAEIKKIIVKCLRKDRDERYQTIKDVLIDLNDVKQDLEFHDKLERSIAPNQEATKTQILKATTLDEVNQTTTNQTVASNPKTNYWAVGLLTLILAVGGLFGYKYFTPNKKIKSIAVMPFVNESGDVNNEYLSDGLSDSLINKLSQLPQLKVIARTSSFRYKGREINVREIADALGVQAIVTGRIAKRGDDLQISVEIIDAAENAQIWGEQYNRKVSDVIGVPQEIAQTVSEKLLVQLTGAQQQQIAKQTTGDSQAYQLYLNGVFYRRRNGADNIKKAIEYQNQAIALDPNFAMAYAEIAIGYGALVEIGAINPAEGKPNARAAAEKAVALDDTLPQAHQTLAYIENQDLNWREAEQNYQRAIELNQNFSGAHTLYAAYLSQLGRSDEALTEIRKAQELDPLRVGLLGNEGMILYRVRRYAEAISKMQDGLKPEPENAPARVYLGRVFTADGQYAKAIREFQTAGKTDSNSTNNLIYSGQAYALSGQRGEALEILNQLKITKKYVSPAALAIFYAALDDKEAAFKSLEQAYAERDPQLQFLKVEPGYDPLRDDSRFQQWLQKVGFPR